MENNNSINKDSIPKNKGIYGGLYFLGSIHTGSSETDPAILKAKSDKAKRDSIASAYKKNTIKK